MAREVIRPDKYQCPVCEHWYGEHMTTGCMSRHKAVGEDMYVLCKGSLTELAGLPHQVSGNLMPARPLSVQDSLFTIEKLTG